MLDYYAYARDQDLYLSYVIIDPQGDRSKAASEGGNGEVAVRIVDEDPGGVTIRGAKMLGTGAALSDEVLVTTLRPLGADEARFAFTAAVPIAAAGVKLMSRRELRTSPRALRLIRGSASAAGAAMSFATTSVSLSY
ncbi:4-hydroxyphenylacetate 3-hydroxylase N-terminal domain-containing protein [Hansschlegelia quercus]|uniref:HpaB/PvcC/4-BUDH N-terminal domain-containing protein n=1 Tax=Hansschlegelia quercus TaxID=2528245 RepID=A0A4Q9GHS3_9HYPH|nr:4-hydroxyphenylacetate 3-hydroxylase N-terminal domain-containing protein [Hansschlegelia quercus]TBN53612.1 hypothetical protein EYR15_07330 [Hansschlegelia quercus]